MEWNLWQFEFHLEELGAVVVDNTGFVDREVEAVRACEHGIYSGSPARCLGKVLSGTTRGALSKACFLCEYLLWSPRWMGGLWEVVSHQRTMRLLGNVNTHATRGQANMDWPERPCRERYFGVPFIYSGQWKINMPVKSIFKNKREVSYLVLFLECKSVSCAIF